ncbi:mycofactocin-coupled SDR family oxidoreductase [Rhodococcus rhodochrous]|uniref:mycofactocin-coupled SDR family oxidoreductase n=1 Tax=Rhodococcus rhodochrous TaxID=1829 RepID=UPI001E5EA55A|nr:mycofactocin-coupled SDR family oxidoreductase [Rhodococcus rhodochrous]MCB8914166.1 mycofactocin-coupled SDR family oxidoreductase [Rhodococcus rhodochrous]
MGMLDGKVVMITGGSRGQGRAHALTSAREGADVLIVDVTEEVENLPTTTSYALATAQDMATTVKEVEALGRRIVAVPADVRIQADLNAAVAQGIEQLGQIDVLIANAGIHSLAPFWEMTDESWEDMIAINLSGVWRSAKAVAPHMIERQTGSIVMISSVNGLEAGPNYSHYTAAKHGVVGLMKTVALELAPHGVRCNAIHPGAVRSGMTDNQAAWDMYAGHPGGTIDDLVSAGRHYGALKGTTFMPADTIANAALFLNSNLASTITGISLPVEAGHLLIPGVNAAPVD